MRDETSDRKCRPDWNAAVLTLSEPSNNNAPLQKQRQIHKLDNLPKAAGRVGTQPLLSLWEPSNNSAPLQTEQEI